MVVVRSGGVGEWGRAWGGEVSSVDCDVGEVG